MTAKTKLEELAFAIFRKNAKWHEDAPLCPQWEINKEGMIDDIVEALRQPPALDEKELEDAAREAFKKSDSLKHTEFMEAYLEGARYAASKNLIARMPSREEVREAFVNNTRNAESCFSWMACYDYLVAEIERGR